MMHRRLSFFVLVFLFFVVGIVSAPPRAFAAVVNDPLFTEQWYLEKIKAPEAWETTRGSRDVIVAIIDTGVDEDHEDLLGNMWVNEDEIPGNGIDDDRNGYIDDRSGWDFHMDHPSPNPKFQGIEEIRKRPLGAHHGTIIAGLIAAEANNGKGIAGVASNVRVMPLRALSSRGVGSIVNVVRALDYAVANGASVINVSFETRIRSSLFLQALRRAAAKGVVVVAAAGNDGDGGGGTDLDVHPLYPVCAGSLSGIRSVIGVGATARDDQKASFSHFGSRCIDLVAPGVDILSTSVLSPRFDLTTSYSKDWSGTSFATGFVAGAAALLKSLDKTLSPDAIRLFLQEGAQRITADPVYEKRLGAGLLDINRSLALFRTTEERTRILTRAREVAALRPATIVVAHSNGKAGSDVRMVDINGRVRKKWFPFGSSYRRDITLASGDTDSDESDEILVSGGEGGGPHVRVFNQRGELSGQFFALEPSYRGGITVATGDVDPDGNKEIVVVPSGLSPVEAHVFSKEGEQQLTFSPFSGEEAKGAVVAAGDVDGEGFDDFVFLTRRSARPLVRVTDVFGNEKFSFSPYSEDMGGASLALADIDGDGVLEIITARGSGIPEVRVWKQKTLVANFLAFTPSFPYGVVVAGGDVDGDGRDEILAVPRSNGRAHVRIFSGEGLLLKQFFTRGKNWRGGMSAAILQ